MRRFRLMTAATLLVSTSLLAQDSSSIDERLRELERRLEQLERKAAEAPSEPDAGAPAETTVEVAELRRQLEVLADEVERMRSGEKVQPLEPERARALGLGPSATRVYERPRGVSWAGYGEMLYENFSNRDQSGVETGRASQLDFVRAILYSGYRFNEKFLFNSEIEIEHGSTGRGGEVSVEFAYLEYLVNQNLSLRGGMLLVPMGLVNEFHEPNVFFGTLRPRTETQILPSTWRENGFGVVGAFGPLQFRSYVINGLNAGGFSASGLRGGRQKGASARAENLAFVGRLDLAPTAGVLVGGSVYHGGSAQGQYRVEGDRLDVPTTLWEIHGQAQFRGFDLRGLLAEGHVGEALELNQARNLTGASAIAERMRGGYLQAAYNLLSRTSESSALSPYYRFEVVDTQNRMPGGFLRNPATDSTFHTLGLEFKPIYNVVIKSDFTWGRNEARSGQNQFNLGLGYSF